MPTLNALLRTILAEKVLNEFLARKVLNGFFNKAVPSRAVLKGSVERMCSFAKMVHMSDASEYR